MRYAVILFFLSLPSTALAQIELGFNASLFLQEEVNGQEYDTETRMGPNVSYIHENHWYQLSYVNFDESTSNGSSCITIENLELMLWYRYLFSNLKDESKWKAFVGLGLGWNWTKIESTLGSTTTQIESDKEPVLGLNFGAKRNLFSKVYYGFSFSALSSQDYSLDPTLELNFIELSYLF